MEPTSSQKISVAPEDLPPLGAMMATAHPDSQEILHRPKASPHEDIPRDIEVVEKMVLGEPFDTFSRGEGSVYLSERAAGTDTLEGLDKTRRLGAEGQALGTWGNTQAVPVKKAYGGFSFGTRAPKGVAAVAASEPAAPSPLPPKVQTEPEGEGSPEGGSPGVAGGDVPAAQAEGEPAPPVIGFLKPPGRREEAEVHAGAVPVAAAPPGGEIPGSRFSATKGPQAKAAPMVTLPSGTKARRKSWGRPALLQGAAGADHVWLPPVGPLGGVGWLAAGAVALVLGSGQVWPRPPRPETVQAYLAWEEGELVKELARRQALHEQRLAAPASQRGLAEMEREERELAVVTEALGRVRGKRNR